MPPPWPGSSIFILTSGRAKGPGVCLSPHSVTPTSYSNALILSITRGFGMDLVYIRKVENKYGGQV